MGKYWLIEEDTLMRESNYAELGAEAVRLCQELIRIPSVNHGGGKGDERAIAEYVANYLRECGLSPTSYQSAESRVSVVARITGRDNTRPGLVVHGHLDTVPADGADWQRDPWSGEIIDGEIWGRGAVDMKNMDAMILAIAKDWHARGYVPQRDVVLAFFADEEAGGTYGVNWIVKNHPEAFAGCSEAISEVGGFSATLSNGKRLYLVETSEKGIYWMELTAEGRAGHGSMVNRENAVTTLAEAVSRIGAHQWPIRITQTLRTFLSTVAQTLGKDFDEKNPAPIVAELGSMARMIGATTQNTANPTMLTAGYKENVIPQYARAVIDGRFLPGFEEEFIRTIKELAGPNISVQPIIHDVALELPFTGELVEAMCEAIKECDPEGIPVPYVMSGGTDNKGLSKLGIAGYGFSPLKLPPELDFMALFHGINERVPVSAIHFGVEALDRFLQRA
jgi:acetylornithine deacetylase/succinyl-diaminopimelate desuccinylase-like protein